ncbi:response regulator transcription factor [Actinomadura graeca]|uniref:Response regulator transcription factor n=1 Tax=Actinomadura graeca TaxID=2750812 RepID=A0ABX8QSV8_9ACTN|nr:response regulator transcription factor [Actinomadura graeca]QXJ21796.1 response regulator transcription factor [Actinomadura graeca]
MHPNWRDDQRLRVVIVDDHPIFREGLRAALESADDVAVVAEAASAQEAVSVTAATSPDVVLMDLDLGCPQSSGIHAIQRLVAELPPVAILVLTTSSDDGDLLATLRAGANGYLVKGACRQEVLHAVRTVAGGGAVFGSGIATRITALLTGGHRHGAESAFPMLTTREREILALLARGKDNRDIARTLFIADKTVRNHVSRIFEKLQVNNRSAAVARARDAGLGDPDDRAVQAAGAQRR